MRIINQVKSSRAPSERPHGALIYDFWIIPPHSTNESQSYPTCQLLVQNTSNTKTILSQESWFMNHATSTSEILTRRAGRVPEAIVTFDFSFLSSLLEEFTD